MTVLDIVNLRDTQLYKNLEFMQSFTTKTDEEAARYILHNIFQQDGFDNSALTVKDAHHFSYTSSCVSLKIPLGGDNALYDGIYDIWLCHCKDIHSISLVFKNIEIPITNFKIYKNNRIQIPLVTTCDDCPSKPVEKLEVTQVQSFFTNVKHVSFIPSIAIQFDEMYIKLNEGASCEVVISTLYLQHFSRREIFCSKNVFKICGASFYTLSGMVHRLEEEKTSNADRNNNVGGGGSSTTCVIS